MKKKILVICASVLLLEGCGTKIPILSNGDDAVVEFKNGDKISVNQLYDELKIKTADVFGKYLDAVHHTATTVKLIGED